MRAKLIALLGCFVAILALSFNNTESIGKEREERDYWDNGSLKSCVKYDAYNHKVEESYYDRKGHLRRGIDGWAAIRWKYKDGNMIEEVYYGDNGRPMERKVYNDDGDLVGKQYFGEDDIDPSEEFNPFPTLAGETIIYSKE